MDILKPIKDVFLINKYELKIIFFEDNSFYADDCCSRVVDTGTYTKKEYLDKNIFEVTTPDKEFIFVNIKKDKKLLCFKFINNKLLTDMYFYE